MFELSKLLSSITQPMFWLTLWWALALLVLIRRNRPAVFMMWGGLAVLVLLGFVAIPNALLRVLEDRFPAPQVVEADRHACIIVLGGALAPLTSL